MTKQLFSLSLEEFLEKHWENVELFHLNSKQRKMFLSNPHLSWEECRFPKGKSYRGMMNNQTEFALVIEGSITHEISSTNYHQSEDDLLILPANLLHHAIIGSNKDCLAYVWYKNASYIR